MFGSRVGFSGTAYLMALFPVRKNTRWRPPPSWEKFYMAISPQPVVQSTSCLVLGWGFRGRRMLWRYFRFEKIQDGGRRHFGKILIIHIFATGRPILSMFGFRVGFSGMADLMALFPDRKNPKWRPPPSWKNFKWPYLRNRSSDPLHVWL